MGSCWPFTSLGLEERNCRSWEEVVESGLAFVTGRRTGRALFSCPVCAQGHSGDCNSFATLGPSARCGGRHHSVLAVDAGNGHQAWALTRISAERVGRFIFQSNQFDCPRAAAIECSNAIVGTAGSQKNSSILHLTWMELSRCFFFKSGFRIALNAFLTEF